MSRACADGIYLYIDRVSPGRIPTQQRLIAQRKNVNANIRVVLDDKIPYQPISASILPVASYHHITPVMIRLI